MWDSSLCLASSFLLLVLVYKAFDWLLRRFYIGDLGNRYIFITGCDTGFGNLAARRLDALGCHVFAGCLTEAGETELSKSCSSRMQTVSLDVSKPDSVRRAFDIVKDKLPPGKGLWGVVNNAGMVSVQGPEDWLTIDDYKSVAAVNLYGLIDVTMTFLPLIKMVRGRVVNTSSSIAKMSIPYIAPYAVSKYGVEAFTDGLRRSMYPFGVKALLVEPGAHKTPLMTIEQGERNCRKAWDQATPEVKAEYGEAFLQGLMTECVGGVQKVASDRLQDVADAYVHALLGRFPRARYAVGWDCKYVWIPMSWMPEWMADRLVGLIVKGPPIAALKKKLQ